MKTQLSFEVFDEYLKITVSGKDDPSREMDELMMTIKRLSEENKRMKILVVAFDVPDVSDMEKFYIGETGANLFGFKIKMAMLRKPEHINKLTENVAVNRGANLYIDSNEQRALDWLLK
jgi:hypothetical protein